MKLEFNVPKFKVPQFKGFTNPLTKEGMRALGIVLGVIVVISGAVYAANFGKRKESMVLPATTEKEAIVTPPAIPTEVPTIAPLTEEEASPASSSPTKKVRKPTEALTPAVEGTTVTPTPTL
ncbi:hypothetical protein HY029_05335 [Candidatus Gottesmanbacteria bacterium]|nr:hypothetical protein [Candidatus Gottesmanbacteria bacterium]